MEKIDLGWGYLFFVGDDAFIAVKPVNSDGKRVSWFSCWRVKRFCGLRLRRPHLTCVHCVFRRAANGEIPPVMKVTFIVVPVTKPLTGFRRLMVKKVTSFLEFLCRW